MKQQFEIDYIVELIKKYDGENITEETLSGSYHSNRIIVRGKEVKWT